MPSRSTELPRKLSVRYSDVPDLDTGLEWKDIDPVAGNAGLIQKQWLYEDSEGAKWIYDIGHSIPGLMLQMDAGDPVFTQSTMHRYSLERDLFGKTRIVLTDVDEEAFYQIAAAHDGGLRGVDR